MIRIMIDDDNNRGYASAESQWKIEWQNKGQIDVNDV